MMKKSWIWGGDDQRAAAPPWRKAGIDAVNGSLSLSIAHFVPRRPL